jgi:hypothetical protein
MVSASAGPRYRRLEIRGAGVYQRDELHVGFDAEQNRHGADLHVYVVAIAAAVNPSEILDACQDVCWPVHSFSNHAALSFAPRFRRLLNCCRLRWRNPVHAIPAWRNPAHVRAKNIAWTSEWLETAL